MTTTGPNTGIAEAMPHAPDGVIIEEPAAGVVRRADRVRGAVRRPEAKPLPFPSDCPVADPNQTPPPPKP